MDTNRIFKGTILWSLGLLVPSIYHALLMLAAVQKDGYSYYSFHNMTRYFFQLPCIVLSYLITMAVVGLILVISGLKNTKYDRFFEDFIRPGRPLSKA